MVRVRGGADDGSSSGSDDDRLTRKEFREQGGQEYEHQPNLEDEVQNATENGASDPGYVGDPSSVSKDKLNEARYGDTDPGDATNERPTETRTSDKRSGSGVTKDQLNEARHGDTDPGDATNEKPSNKRTSDKADGSPNVEVGDGPIANNWEAYWEREGRYKKNQQAYKRDRAQMKAALKKGKPLDALLNAGGMVSTSNRGRLDYLLDNPAFSVQESVGKPTTKGFYEIYDATVNDEKLIDKAGTPGDEMSDKELARRMHGSWEGTTQKLAPIQTETEKTLEAHPAIPKGTFTDQGLQKWAAKQGGAGRTAAIGMNLAGNAPEYFVSDPVEETMTAGTGIDAETKETEDRAKVADIADVLAFGGGRIARSAGTKMSIFDDAGTKIDETAEETAKKGEDTTSQDTFDQQPRDAGYDESYNTFDDSSVGELRNRGQSPRGKSDAADVNKQTPDQTEGGSQYGPLGYELDSSPVTKSDEVSRNSKGVSETNGPSDAGSPTQSQLVKSLSEQLPGDTTIPDVRAALDETGSKSDEAASGSDEAGSKADESETTASTYQRAREVGASRAKAVGMQASALIDDLTPGGKWTGNAVKFTGFTLGVGAANRWLWNGGDKSVTGPGANDGGLYWMEKLTMLDFPAALTKSGKPMPTGALMRIVKGKQTVGYTVAVPKQAVPRGHLQKGVVEYVLNKDARPVPPEYIKNETTKNQKAGPFFKPTFQSQGAAKEAWNQYISYVRQQFNSGGNSKYTNTPASSLWSGSLTPPKAVKQGKSFEVEYSVKATKDIQSPKSTRLVLVAVSGQTGKPLMSTNIAVEAGQATTSGKITVPQGALSLAPGTYKLDLVATGPTKAAAGRVASSTLDVKPTDDGSKNRNNTDGSTWDDPQRVKTLPKGWHLYSQTKVGSNKTRFMVVGKNAAGQMLFLHKDGVGRTQPNYFPTPPAAMKAYRRWATRLENGETKQSQTPDPGAGKPDSARIKKEAAAFDNRDSGVLSSLATAADEQPLMVGGLSLAALVGGVLVARATGWI